MPMARSAVLIGRTAADLLRNVLIILLMIAVGYIIGFSFQGGVGQAIACIALVSAFGLALSWIFAFVALTVRSAEAAQSAGFVVLFPLVFASSVFVPVSSLPSWLASFAKRQAEPARRRLARVSTFVFRLKAPRPTFALDMTDAEREIMGQHAAHWRPLVDSGQMVVFGPVLDSAGSWGLGVVESDDEAELREFAARDPVVTTGTAEIEIGTMLAGFVRSA